MRLHVPSGFIHGARPGVVLVVRPEIYGSIKVDVGGVPLPAVCGAIDFASGIFFLATNAGLLKPLDIFISSLALGIGLFLFLYSSRNKRGVVQPRSPLQ